MAALDGRGTLSGRLYPGADSDASGVAAMLDIAGRLAASPIRPRSVLFVALDGHCRNSSGAAALLKAISSGLVPDPVTETPLKTSRIDLVANLDIIGSTLSPVLKYYKEYLIVLGGSRWERRFESLNAPYQLHLTYDYYGSRDFTNLFYRKTGDHKPFLDAGIHCLVFTSGITMRTNKPTDDAPSLNYTALEKRTGLISEFLLSF